MKIQEVLLRAMARKITWFQAAEILGFSDRHVRRIRERYEEFGYDGLFDRRRGQPSPKRVPFATVEAVLGLYREKYFDLNHLRPFAQSSLYKILYLHWTSGSCLDLLRQLARELDIEPAGRSGDLVRQISDTIVRLNQSKKQHLILICDEAHLLCHPALEQFPLLLNFDMDSGTT